MFRKIFVPLAIVIMLSLVLGGSQAVIASRIGTITRVSVSSAGVEGNKVSGTPSISSDGRLIAFVSYSNNLVDGGTAENRAHIYVHDRLAKTTELISFNFQSNEEANAHSFNPSISSDGRYVAFESAASNLSTANTSGRRQIFIHDRLGTRETKLVSLANGTQDGGNNDSITPSISGDGRFIAFSSKATNLIHDWSSTPNRSHIYVYDQHFSSIHWVTYGEINVEGNNDSRDPVISQNGEYIAFNSQATNLVSDWSLTADRWHIYRRKTLGFDTKLVSSAYQANLEGNNHSIQPAISSDGTIVAFSSLATNLVDPNWFITKDFWQVYAQNIIETDTYLVSRAYDANLQGNEGSLYPSISGDGIYVVFHSLADNLVENDLNIGDAYLHDRQNTNTILISTGFDESPANGESSHPVISADGSTIAFHSSAANLVVNDTNDQQDVFVFGSKIAHMLFLPLILK